MKKAFLEKNWNGGHLEEEEERPGNLWMQEVTTGMRERRELTTWNGSTEKGEEEK